MPEGGKVTPINTSVLGRLTGAVRYAIRGVEPGAPFSPNQPLTPIIQPLQGRLWDLPVGYNLQTNPRPDSSDVYAQLRALADNCDIVRMLIETRKDQIEALPWQISLKASADDMDAKSPAVKNKIAEVAAFFEQPDGFNGWHEWLRMLVEDMLVVDAATLYKQRTRGGQLLALEVMDGTMVAVKVDQFGRIPQAPDPAYQQQIQGLPAVDYSTDELMFMPRNRRSFDVYGFSPVEQIVMTMNIVMRRSISQLQYYTDSNLPKGLLELPDIDSASSSEFMKSFNAKLSGNTATRQSLIPVINGVKYTELKQPAIVDAADEWYARLCCYAFSISPQSFVKETNRATAETAKTAAEQEGLVPIQLWIKRQIDKVIREEFDAPFLEFVWQDDKEIDPTTQMNVQTGYVKAGLRSINEAREIMGDEPIADPAYDALMVATATGYVAIKSPEEQEQDAQDAADQAQATLHATLAAKNPDGSQSGDSNSVVPPKGAKTKDKPKPVAKPDAADKAHTHDAGPYSNMTKGVRQKRPIPFDRVLVRQNRSGLKKKIALVLEITGKEIAKQYRDGLFKADSPSADTIDLSGLLGLTDVTGIFLENVFKDSELLALAQVGVTAEGDIVDQVADRAVAFASERAAEMVGKRRLADGSLVDNPDAIWRIDEATRNEVRAIITHGIAENIGRDDIAGLIADSGAFNEARAQLIADTEIARANGFGVLEGWKVAESVGVEVDKEWYVDEDPCPICQENADEGPIPLDQEFPSGDLANPAHPRCECVMIPVERKAQTSGDDDAG